MWVVDGLRLARVKRAAFFLGARDSHERGCACGVVDGLVVDAGRAGTGAGRCIAISSGARPSGVLTCATNTNPPPQTCSWITGTAPPPHCCRSQTGLLSDHTQRLEVASIWKY